MTQAGSTAWRRAATAATALLPGLALVLLVAIASRLFHGLLPSAAGKVVGEVILAVLLGLTIRSALPLPERLAPGIRFSFRTILRFAIVLLGARFAFTQVLAIGGKSLVIIVVLIALALAVAHWLGRRTGTSRELSTLIGVGTAICGNSAISATAPVIRARDEDVSFAIATNTLLGTLAVFLYPIVGHLFGFSSEFFGTWAGTAVNDTSQVVATGFAYGEASGKLATAVKLTRNALMGFVIVGIGFAYARGDGSRRKNGTLARRIRQSVPLFVVGFLLMALLNTLGFFDWISRTSGRDVAAELGTAARFLILMALAGVGLGTDVAAMRRIGPKPFYLGVATAATTSIASLLLILLLGPAH